MRVIAGKYRSRQLKSLKGKALRPTSDRLRETLFNVIGQRIEGVRFVDAFAGTGAVGIEALSRGAREVIFIEKYSPAATLIKKNLASLDIRDHARVLCLDAVHGLEILHQENRTSELAPGMVYLDPPYGNTEDYDRVLSFLGFATLLREGSLVIAEHRRNFELPEVAGKLHRVRVLRQGDAVLSFYRFVAQNSESATAAQ